MRDVRGECIGERLMPGRQGIRIPVPLIQAEDGDERLAHRLGEGVAR
jgi:hypothetical protein